MGNKVLWIFELKAVGKSQAYVKTMLEPEFEATLQHLYIESSDSTCFKHLSMVLGRFEV